MLLAWKQNNSLSPLNLSELRFIDLLVLGYCNKESKTGKERGADLSSSISQNKMKNLGRESSRHTS